MFVKKSYNPDFELTDKNAFEQPFTKGSSLVILGKAGSNRNKVFSLSS